MCVNGMQKEYLNLNPFEFTYVPKDAMDFNGIVVLLREPRGDEIDTYSKEIKEKCIKENKEWFKKLIRDQKNSYKSALMRIIEHGGLDSQIDHIAYGNIKWSPGPANHSGKYGEIGACEMVSVVNAAIDYWNDKYIKGESRTPVKRIFVCYEVLDAIKCARVNALLSEDELVPDYMPCLGIKYRINKQVKRATKYRGIEVFEILHPCRNYYFSWTAFQKESVLFSKGEKRKIGKECSICKKDKNARAS